MTVADRRTPSILVVAPSAPPIHGVSIATQLLLPALKQAAFRVYYVDTSEHRPISTLERLDLSNILAGLRSVASALLLMLLKRPGALYLPVSQNGKAFV